MRLKVIPIIVAALGSVSKSLEKGLEELEISERIETIQTTVFLKSIRILKRVLETCVDLVSSRRQWKTNS